MRILLKLAIACAVATIYGQDVPIPGATPNKPVKALRIGPGSSIEANSGEFTIQPGVVMRFATGSTIELTNATVVGLTIGGSVGDASTTVKGVMKLATTPVLNSNPIAVGDNDPRVNGTSTGLFGSASDRGMEKLIHFNIRPDNKVGSGTKEDPYRSVDFDTRMRAFFLAGTPNIHAVLGPDSASATFTTNQISTNWYPKTGWTIEGSGMFSTTIVNANLQITTPYEEHWDNVTFKNLTIDANWPNLANTYADGATVRTFTVDSVSGGVITSTNGNFISFDVGRRIVATGIPANSWVGAVNPGANTLSVSSSPVANIPVTVTSAPGTTVTISEKNVATGVLDLKGNNILLDHFRGINAFGTNKNSHESFVIILASAPTHNNGHPAFNDAVNCRIIESRVEQCWGNYGNPVGLFGFGPGSSPSYPDSDSWLGEAEVRGCTFIGKPGAIGANPPGSDTPFTSGGINLARVRNVKITDNTFINCAIAAYLDTDDYDGIEFSNNTVINTALGAVGLHTSGTNQSDWNTGDQNRGRNVRITNNHIFTQRRVTGGANYHLIVEGSSLVPNVIIEDNDLYYDAAGPGNDTIWTILAGAMLSGSIKNNYFDTDGHARIGVNGVTDGDSDTNIEITGNRLPNRNAPTSMADNNGILKVTSLGLPSPSTIIPSTIRTVILDPPSALTGHVYIRAPYHTAFKTFAVLDPKGVINASHQLIIQKSAADSTVNGAVPPSGDIVAALAPRKRVNVTSNLVNGINVYTDIQSSDYSTVGQNLSTAANPAAPSFQRVDANGGITYQTTAQMGISPQFRSDLTSSAGLAAVPTVAGAMAYNQMLSFVNSDLTGPAVTTYILSPNFTGDSLEVTPSDFNAGTNNRKWMGLYKTWVNGSITLIRSATAVVGTSGASLGAGGLLLNGGGSLGLLVDQTGSGSASFGIDGAIGYRFTGSAASTFLMARINPPVNVSGVKAGVFRLMLNKGTDSWTINKYDSTPVGTLLPGESVIALAKNDGNWDLIYFDRVGPKYTPNASASGTITLTCDPLHSPNRHEITLVGNGTVAFSGLRDGMSGLLVVKQDATGSRTLALPAGSKVQNNGMGVPPLTSGANGIDILSWTYDGTNLFWGVANNFN